MRRTLLVALLATLLPDAAGHAATVRLPAAPPARAELLALAEGLRPLPYETSLATVLARAARLDGRAATPLPARVAPLPASVPAALRPPLGRLLAAVEDATAAARAATAGRLTEHRVTLTGSTASVAPPAVDLTGLATAAATVLAAIDATTPALSGSPARHDRAAGCDVLDQAPLLCVGGSGANAHTGDYALLVDLGGDDSYTGSTGGADVERNGLPVSVALDLGGNDRYAAVVGTTTTSTAALGAARGGVGVLVDVSGDDSYAVRSGPRTDHLLGIAGIGAALQGVALHADLDGRDRYLVTSTANGPTEAFQLSNGGATLDVVVLSPLWAAGAGEAGIGVQLDAGADGDAYAVEARPAPVRAAGRWHAGRVIARGLGFGGAGVGLALDDGGTDTQTLRASFARADGPAAVERQQAAIVEGLGLGAFGGVGAVVAGDGRTDRQAYALARVPSAEPHAGLDVLGVSRSAGTGLVVDAGGDDRYKAWGDVAVVRATKYARVARGGLLFVGAMGAANGDGRGALLDAAGDDVYLVVGHNAANVRGSGPRTSSVEWAESVSLGASENRGTGLLVDTSGDDVYVSDTAIFASGTVRSVAGARHLAQGASGSGYGELRDLGGKDAYLARPYVNPAPPAGAFLAFQGSGGHSFGGAGVFVDVGGADGFLPTPDQPAPCVGRRGDAYWVDCPNRMGYVGPVSLGTGAGVGVNT